MAWYDRVKFTLKETFIPDGEQKVGNWNRCTNCQEVIYEKDLILNLKVCSHCDHHYRLNAPERIEVICDKESFQELWANLQNVDFLKFVDGKSSYSDKIKSAMAKTNMMDAIMTGTAEINKIPVVVAIMDFSFLGGSMGSVMGEKIDRAVNLAIKKKCPFIISCCSGGARMHEGTTSLMQMAKTCAALAQLNKANLPYISLLTDPTTGGVTASFASVGDVIIAEPNALIGFAGARVIEQTIKQKLPEGFQRSEFLIKHGFVDRIIHRRNLKEELAFTLNWFMEK